ncbi:spore coat associated protein CotJA [Paenibacillus assamensis]|uniref:spore coat associated protein CotJA n=1 Tax=Paenibacillus assamensis TaxID=311244 RepID=UPI0004219692|nr:spore coat associated protein CotJA [Paenibacillus assamensis]
MAQAGEPDNRSKKSEKAGSSPQSLNSFLENYQEVRKYVPFRGLYDPCPPLPYKTYVVPINQYINFQPPNWPQFPFNQALKHGTLWPFLYSSYQSQRGGTKDEQ